MYYEEQRHKKKRKHKHRSLLGWLFRLIFRLAVRVLLLAVIICLLLYLLPVGLFITEPVGNVNPSPDLGNNMINILLLGVDHSDDSDGTGSTQRADTIMIVSVGFNEVRLTSVLRDTLVNVPGHGSHKLNAAYSYGGPELTMRTLNQNFGFNITKYAVVDFFAVADIINAVGGIDVTISEAEQTELNRILRKSWIQDFSKHGYDVSDTSYVELSFANADANGEVPAHLDGFQALSYARIRKIGNSDYERTLRQRQVLSLGLAKFRSKWYNPVVLYRLAEAVTAHTQTNMNIVEIMSIGLKAVFADDIPQLRLPANGTYYDNGSSLASIDFDANRQKFIDFVYSDSE